MADRFEREIDEILRKIDDFIPENGQGRRRPPRPNSGNSSINRAQTWFARTLSAISLNQVMLWSLLAFLGAFFLRAIPGAGWLMIAALIVFATAFLLQLMTPKTRRTGPEKRWRGERIDYSTGPTWPNRLKAWLKGRRKA